MKPQKIKIFGLFATDGSGYNTKAVGYWPIAAAAEAAKGNNYYLNVSSVDAIRLDDVIYLLEKEVSKESIVESFPSLTPILGYENYDYQDHRFPQDQTQYCASLEKADEWLIDGKHHSIKKVWLFSDTEGGYYILKSEKSIKLEPFTMSRDLAVKHALSKLTEEEKKLLGIT